MSLADAEGLGQPLLLSPFGPQCLSSDFNEATSDLQQRE